MAAARLLSRVAPAAIAVGLGVGVYIFAKRGANRVPEHVKEAVAAGAAALDKGQHGAAATSFQKGVDGLVAADSHPILAAELLLHNADALESSGQLQEAADAFRQAEALCAEVKKRKDMPAAALTRLDVHGKQLVALARRAELEAQLGHASAARAALKAAQALLLETQRPLLQRAFSALALPSAVCSRIPGGSAAIASAFASAAGALPVRGGGAATSSATAQAAARSAVAAANALREIPDADRRRLADAAGVFFNAAMQAAAEAEAEAEADAEAERAATAAASSAKCSAGGGAGRYSSEAAGLSFLAFAFVWAALQGAIAAAEREASQGKGGKRAQAGAEAVGGSGRGSDSLWRLNLLPDGSPALAHEVSFPLGLPDHVNSAAAGAALGGAGSAAAASPALSSSTGLGPITLSSCLTAGEMLSCIAAAEAKLAALPAGRQPASDSEAGSLAALCGAAARLCTVALWQLHEEGRPGGAAAASTAVAAGTE